MSTGLTKYYAINKIGRHFYIESGDFRCKETAADILGINQEVKLILTEEEAKTLLRSLILYLI